jgi:hypothetical protein
MVITRPDYELYGTALKKVGTFYVSYPQSVPKLKLFQDGLSIAWVSKEEELIEENHSGTILALQRHQNPLDVSSLA